MFRQISYFCSKNKLWYGQIAICLDKKAKCPGEVRFIQTNGNLYRRIIYFFTDKHNIINIYILRSNTNNLLLIVLLLGKGRYPLDNSPSLKKNFLELRTRIWNRARVCTCMATNHVLVIWFNSLLQLNSKRSKIL